MAIIRTREARQVRERASPSVGTIGRRGGGGVSGGDEASIAVIQDEEVQLFCSGDGLLLAVRVSGLSIAVRVINVKFPMKGNYIKFQ